MRFGSRRRSGNIWEEEIPLNDGVVSQAVRRIEAELRLQLNGVSDGSRVEHQCEKQEPHPDFTRLVVGGESDAFDPMHVRGAFDQEQKVDDSVKIALAGDAPTDLAGPAEAARSNRQAREVGFVEPGERNLPNQHFAGPGGSLIEIVGKSALRNFFEGILSVKKFSAFLVGLGEFLAQEAGLLIDFLERFEKETFGEKPDDENSENPTHDPR